MKRMLVAMWLVAGLTGEAKAETTWRYFDGDGNSISESEYNRQLNKYNDYYKSSPRVTTYSNGARELSWSRVSGGSSYSYRSSRSYSRSSRSGSSYYTRNNYGTSYGTENNYGTSYKTINNYGNSHTTINNYGNGRTTVNDYGGSRTTVNRR